MVFINFINRIAKDRHTYRLNYNRFTALDLCLNVT